MSNRFSWPAGVRAAVSVTFDDARPTQLNAGLPILDRFRVKGTFYVSLPALEQRADDWRSAAGKGHEVGNHTTTHPCTGNFAFARKTALEDYTLDRIERDILDASEAIADITGVRPTTFAYPCGQTFVGRGQQLQSYIPVVARHFLAGRGWRCESMAAPDFCDLAHLPAMELDNLEPDQAQALIDDALTRGDWLIFAGHEVRDAGRQSVHPHTLKRLCVYCQDPAHGVWLDTVAAISQYVRDWRKE